MNQISRPLQIALLGVVLVAAAYFLFLRKGAEEPAPAPTPAAPAAQAPSSNAPGVDGLNRAVDKAKGAAATSDKANAAAEKATADGSASKPSADATSASPSKKVSGGDSVTSAGPAVKDPASAKDKTAAAAGDPATGLLQQLKPGKVVVLAFLGDGADDRAARRAVKTAGKEKWIITRTTPIGNVGKYASISQNLNIMVAPSVVVIGHDKVAQVLTGFVDAKVVKQYAGDARERAAKQK